MQHHGREFAFLGFFFFLFVGIVAFGLANGTLPTRSGLSKREDGPVAFYFVLGLYACIALVPLLGAIDLFLRTNHHRGLFVFF